MIVDDPYFPASAMPDRDWWQALWPDPAKVLEALALRAGDNTFHGVPDKAALAHGVLSVLKPGGRFAIVNWHPLPREQTSVLGKPRGPATAMRMSPQAVQAVVEPAGFRLEQVVELPPYHYGAIFAAKAGTGRTQARPL